MFPRIQQSNLIQYSRVFNSQISFNIPAYSTVKYSFNILAYSTVKSHSIFSTFNSQISFNIPAYSTVKSHSIPAYSTVKSHSIFRLFNSQISFLILAYSTVKSHSIFPLIRQSNLILCSRVFNSQISSIFIQ